MSIAYTIWNVRPQLIDLGNFEIRFYSLLFALGFVAGYFILSRIFRKDGLDAELIDRLTIYMVISTIIGARLGHCMFYEFDYYIRHPLEIFLPWRGTLGEDFRFTGFQGLASHGAAIGILVGLYLFARKTKTSYLWVLDMIVMVTALAGVMIRTGNLMNSEIYGKPTNSHYGFVFTRDLTTVVSDQLGNSMEKISYQKIRNAQNEEGYVPLTMDIQFTRRISDEEVVRRFGEVTLPEDLSRYNFDNNVKAPPADSLSYNIERDIDGFHFSATILGLPRHPSQIYEAASYFLIFVFLFFVFFRLRTRLRNGYIFGLFLTLVFFARFMIEFIKENQESFEDNLSLNMGQILSIPLIVIGIIFIVLKWPRKPDPGLNPGRDKS